MLKYPIFQYCIGLSIRYTDTKLRVHRNIGIDQVAIDIALKLITLIE